MENAPDEKFIELIKEVPGLDVEFSLDNIGGSVKLYRQILKNVIRLLPANIEAADNAFEAGDRNDFVIAVHGMKSSFNQVGCLRLARLAEALENAAGLGDLLYCKEYFGGFKEGALLFCEQVSVVMREAETTAGFEINSTVEGCLSDFTDELRKAKEAAEGFDSGLAVKYLAPLRKYHFGESFDMLIIQAMEELEVFRPRQAVRFIDDLLKEC